jgi:hypothetical protein
MLSQRSSACYPLVSSQEAHIRTRLLVVQIQQLSTVNDLCALACGALAGCEIDLGGRAFTGATDDEDLSATTNPDRSTGRLLANAERLLGPQPDAINTYTWRPHGRSSGSRALCSASGTLAVGSTTLANGELQIPPGFHLLIAGNCVLKNLIIRGASRAHSASWTASVSLCKSMRKMNIF